MDKLVMTQREFYLKRLLSLAENDDLVFVVGVRRAGKSCLAIQLEESLRESCTEHEYVVRHNFETTEAVHVTADAMISDFLEKHTEGQKCYILLDEVTHVNDWKAAVNFFS